MNVPVSGDPKGAPPRADRPAQPTESPTATPEASTVPGHQVQPLKPKPAPANTDAGGPSPQKLAEEVERARLAAKRMARKAAKFKAAADEKARAAAEAEAASRKRVAAANRAAAEGGGQTGQTMPTVVRQPGRTDLVEQAPAQVPGPPKPPETPAKPVLPPVSHSRFRFRHWMLVLSFLMMVVAPTTISGWYLWTRAADQYASYAGFSVRTEEPTPSITSLLGPLGGLGGTTTPDADILYEFIQSQNLVAAIDAKLDLSTIWSKSDPRLDPYYAFHPPGTVEDLLSHWKRMVRLVYDSANGLIELRVLAFAPEDAKAIADAILTESTALINELSNAAREDAIRYARVELERASEKLKDARRTMTEFRNRNQIVDPEIDIASQASILGTLQAQLAEALIERDLLGETARPGDPRIVRIERRVKAIEGRIAEEKRKFGISGAEGDAEAFATLVGEFESLTVEREFAEQSYTAARVAFDTAQAEAVRQTRYLAVHVQPSQAERAEYPKRTSNLGLITLFAFLIWSVVVLVAYALRDRR